MSAPAIPVYRVEFWSGSTLKYAFGYGATNYVTSLSVKQGLTSTIGSFEIIIPDTTAILGVPGAFKDINVFEDVKIWYGYDITGSTNQFAGKIETIRSEFSARNGWLRTFIGRDYKECMDRILQSRGYYHDDLFPEDDAADNIVKSLRNLCTGSTKGNLSTDDAYIVASATEYPSSVENEKVFNIMKTISDFVAYDFYVDVNKKLHWLPRDSVAGAEVFTTGANIKDYRVDRELSHVINQVYAFGQRDPSWTGSDWPQDHDIWTETGSETTGSSWTSRVTDVIRGIDTGSTRIYDDINKISGSYSIDFYIGNPGFQNGDNVVFTATKTLPKTLFVTNGDFLHVYYGTLWALETPVKCYVRLETDSNNYFESRIEDHYKWWGIGGGYAGYLEYTLFLGPEYEGFSQIGSQDSTTGSYRWKRIGYPDWFNINSITFLTSGSWNGGAVGQANIFLDGLYIGTKFQAIGSNITSQNLYGFRPQIENSNTYNSNLYCQNIADTLIIRQKDPIIQTTITVTGSPGLQVGNMYLINIGSEGFTPANLALIDLEHKFDSQGYTSICTFTNKVELGNVIPIINYPVMASQHQWNFWEWLRKRLFPGIPGMPQNIP
jgi:hypothetical protein